MPTNTGILNIPTGYLNTADDTYPGGGSDSPGFAPGQLGQVAQLSSAAAAKLSKTSVATLYGGAYQYVKFKAGSTASNARGQVVYWDDEANYVVTPDAPTSGARIAGITLNAVTKGSHGWIQIKGLAGVLFKATPTKATPAVDDLVVATVSANTGDVLADATAIVSPNLKLALGVAKAAPVGGAVSLVELRTLTEIG